MFSATIMHPTKPSQATESLQVWGVDVSWCILSFPKRISIEFNSIGSATTAASRVSITQDCSLPVWCIPPSLLSEQQLLIVIPHMKQCGGPHALRVSQWAGGEGFQDGYVLHCVLHCSGGQRKHYIQYNLNSCLNVFKYVCQIVGLSSKSSL